MFCRGSMDYENNAEYSKNLVGFFYKNNIRSMFGNGITGEELVQPGLLFTGQRAELHS